MYKWGKTSKDRLATCDKRLQDLADMMLARSKFDLTITCGYRTEEEQNEAYLYVLNKAAENFMKDGILTDTEESLIRSYASAFSLPIDNLPAKYKDTDLAKMGQMTVLKNFAKGIMPSTFVQLPVLLGKTESLLWTYNGVTFYQEKIERETVRNMYLSILRD